MAFSSGNPAENLAVLTQLTALNLRASQAIARHLPRQMNFDSLITANLSHCFLEALPACLHVAAQLRHLDILHNRIEQFPPLAQVPTPC